MIMTHKTIYARILMSLDTKIQNQKELSKRLKVSEGDISKKLKYLKKKHFITEANTNQIGNFYYLTKSGEFMIMIYKQMIEFNK